jgi:FtsH-binding integral membrane protein
MRRFLIFGLLGPAATYLSIDLATRTAERWWWPQPPIYVVELLPFLVCAFVDRAMKDARAWERLVLAGVSAILLSGLASAFAYGGLAAWVFGLYAAIPGAACSLLATATDIEDTTPIQDGDS